MQQVQVGPVGLWVRPGTWDQQIAQEVITGDCYRFGGWSPTNPSVVVDVGGHIGSFSRWAAQRLPDARIFTFEMDEGNQSVCERNLGPLSNVTLIKAALGVRDGDVVRGPVHTDNTGGGHVEWGAAEGPRVAAMSVKTFLREHKVDYIDCLKLDCEGSEFGLITLLSEMPGGLRARVGCIRAELHAERGDDRYNKILGQLNAAFPFVEVAPTASPQQQYLFAWR